MSTSLLLRSLRCAAAPIAALVLLAAAGGASAAPSQLSLTSVTTERNYAQLSIYDARAAIIGDFNGDGIDDHAYAVHEAFAAGELRVVFGAPGSPSGGGTVRFTGAYGPDSSYVVDGAGDMDGDGFDDIIVAQAGPASVAYIIYGAASTPASTVLTGGARITALATGTPGSPLVEGIGDFNGDGLDDVAVAQGTGSMGTFNPAVSQAIVLGGPRLRSLSLLVRSSRVSLLKGITKCEIYWVYPVCGATIPRLTGVGDFNGDGKDDVVVDSMGPAGRHLVFGRTGTFAASANSPGANSVSLTARLAASQRNEAYDDRKVYGAGDLNGDGYAELVIPISRADYEGPQWALLLGRPNPPAVLTGAEPVIRLGRPNEVFVAQAAGDQNGDGRDDLFVAGQYEAVVVSLPAGASSATPVDLSTLAPLFVRASRFDWDIDGAGDLDGDGALDLITSTQLEVSLITHAPREYPDPLPRECTPVMTPNKFRVSDGAMVSVAPCTDIKLGVGYRVSGEQGGTYRAVTLGQGQTQTPFVATGPMAPGIYTLSVAPYPLSDYDWTIPRYTTFEILPEPTPTTPPATTPPATTPPATTPPATTPPSPLPLTMSDPRWVRSGSASLVRGDKMVLTKGAAQVGSAVWPIPFDPNGKSISFTADLSGGNGQAEGITLAFLRGSAPLPAGGLVGGGLGKLGFGGLDGIALALDLKVESSDPNSFLGIADGERGESLNYLQTAEPKTLLRGTPVSVRFTSKDGVVSVYLNEKLRLTRTMTLPSEARLAFTGSTGATTWQNQSVSKFSIRDS